MPKTIRFGSILKRVCLKNGLTLGLSLGLSLLPMLIHANNSQGDLFDLDLEALLQLTITTASKEEESLSRSTSVSHVITRAEIDRSGARTINDLLTRVVGFFPSSQATWRVTGSRGIFSDSNDHILMLIDGHRQNSVVGQGYQQQDDYPLLDKVEQIEIVRGPGSVLWGSSAVFGIINVITRDSKLQDQSEVTVSYSAEDRMRSLNAIHFFGAKESNQESVIKGLVSASYWRSDGYDRDGNTQSVDAFSRDDAQGVIANTEFPWGILGSWPAQNEHHEGIEVYAKTLISDEHELLARFLDASVTYPWDSLTPEDESELRTRKIYLEYRREIAVSESTRINYSVYGDMLLQNRFPLEPLNETSTSNRIQDQSNEETAFSVEVAITHRWSDQHRIKSGVQFVRTDIGPNRDARYSPATNLANNRDDDGNDIPFIGVESGIDKNKAVYVEDHFTFNRGATSVFAGARWDNNDFREDKSVVLPRAGIVHEFSKEITGKYVFNTGYLRPNAVYAKTVGVIVDETRSEGAQSILRVTDSEKVISHDLWLGWDRGAHFFSAGLFYMEITDFISFDAINVPQGYKNLGELETRGIELMGRTQLTNRLSIYGNFSFARASSRDDIAHGAISNDDERLLNYPERVLNVGADIMIFDSANLNIHYNLWQEMRVIKSIKDADAFGEYGTLDGEGYLDINVRFRQFVDLPVDINIFVKNLLDNDDRIGQVTNGGYWYLEGRNLGVNVRLRY